MADCSKLSKLVLEMTELISESPSVRNIDDALAVMQESVPTMSREEYVGHITDAVEANRKKSIKLANTFREIKAEATVDKRLRKTAAKLEAFIETGTYQAKQRKGKKATEPIQELKDLVAGLRKVLAQTEAAKKHRKGRLEPKTIERLKKEITTIEDHILKGTLPEKVAGKKIEPGEMVKYLQERRKQLKKEMSKTEPAVIYRLKGQIKTLEDRIKDGDIFPKPRESESLSKEAQKLSYQKDRLKQEIRTRIKAAEPKGVWGYTKEGANAFRAFMTGGEFSLVLRQGGIIAVTRPTITIKALPKMFKSFLSRDASHKINEAILNRPNAPLYAKAGLQISPIDGSATLSQMEELYMSHWIEKVPVMKNFQRAGLTFLNEIRADAFDVLSKSLPITEKGAQNQIELEAIANYVNAATGRGKLGFLEKSAEGLNTLFFAPRYVTSRFQMLLGEPMWGGTKATRKIVAKEYARFAAGATVVTTLGLLAGAEIEWDPRSTDFGKMKFGNTRLDPWAGISQVTVFVSRVISGESKTGRGDIVPLRPRKYIVAGEKEKLGYAANNAWDVTHRFIRGKLSPMASSGVDLLLVGENIVGEEVTVGTLFGKIDEEGIHLGNLYVPLAWRDIYEAMLEQGIPTGTALSMLTYFGTGLQTYEARKKSGKKVIK